MASKLPVKDARPLRGARAPPPSTSTHTKVGTKLDELDAALDRAVAPAKPEVPPSPLLQPLSAPEKPGPQEPRSPTYGELAARTAARTAARLDQLERLLRTQESDLRKRDSEIQRLQRENRSLQQENREMHRFLADYGLQWVGGSERSTPRGESSPSTGSSVTSSSAPSRPQTASGDEAPGPATAQPRNRFAGGSQAQVPARASAKEPQPPSSSSGPSAGGRSGKPPREVAALPTGSAVAEAGSAGGAPSGCSAGSPPDMERVRRAVQELNALADGTGGEVVRRRDGTYTLATPSLNLTFWLDGLQLDEAPVRPYARSDCIAFLRDLLDGFFPYELKHAYPEGVTFTLGEQTHRRHGSAAPEQPHDWGLGRRLDSRGDGRVAPLSALFGADGAARATARAVVADAAGVGEGAAAGCDLTARESAALPKAATMAAHTAAERAGAARTPEPSSIGCGSGGSGSGVGSGVGSVRATNLGCDLGCKLQIKGSNGGVACVLSMAPTATLAELRRAIITSDASIVPSGASFTLHTAFPAKLLDDEGSTLVALGLVPSASLCVRITKAA